MTNCGAEASTVTSTVGGSITVGDSWSVGGSVGFNLGALRLAAGGNWSQSQSLEASQSIEIPIHAGQMVRLCTVSPVVPAIDSALRVL